MIDDADVTIPQRQRQEFAALQWYPPLTSVQRKKWNWEFSTWCQLWRYWIGLPSTGGRPVSWLEHWLDFFAMNAYQPLCGQWQSELSIKRQLWRFAAATTRLWEMCKTDGGPLQDAECITVHPALPRTGSTGRSSKLWCPDAVAKLIQRMVTLNEGVKDTWTIPWSDLVVEAELRQVRHGIPTSPPSSAIFGVLRGKQPVHPARLQLEKLTGDDDVLDQDPIELDYSIISTFAPADFIHRQGEKLKRRLLTMRARWLVFAQVLRSQDTHWLAPLWGQKKFRCYGCQNLISFDRIAQYTKTRCLGAANVPEAMLPLWEQRVGDYTKWLSQPMTLPDSPINQLLIHAHELGRCTLSDVWGWLGCDPGMKKNLLVGRLRQLRTRWREVATSWTAPRRHKPVFASITARPCFCACCGTYPPEVAKIKSFLAQDCDQSFDMLHDDVVRMTQICDKIDQSFAAVLREDD